MGVSRQLDQTALTNQGALTDEGALNRQAALDNPAWASLTGPHRRFAEIHGKAARYLPEVAPFVALHGPDPWADAAALVGPGNAFGLADDDLTPPIGWQVAGAGGGVQMTGEHLQPARDPAARVLGPADLPQIIELVDRTRPGPFRPRTIELGCYLGIREGDRLVAMAGERMRPPGWTEISAVCTDPEFRGRGLATRLVLAVAAGIMARGDRPMLHATADNTAAIALYHRLGFRVRRTNRFRMVTVPPA